MQIFTNISKISFSILREKGFLFVVYVDDSYFQGKNYERCFSNVLNAIKILRSLRFKFIPTQCITYLGFILNSAQIKITLTLEKKEKILNLSKKFLEMI